MCWGVSGALQATKGDKVTKLQLVLLLEGDKGWIHSPLPSWSSTGCDLAQELPSGGPWPLRILISSHFLQCFHTFPPAVTRSCCSSLLPVFPKKSGCCRAGIVPILAVLGWCWSCDSQHKFVLFLCFWQLPGSVCARLSPALSWQREGSGTALPVPKTHI